MLQARGGFGGHARGSSLESQAIDFEGEVNLFHFYLLRSVGKGAFGKVCSIVVDPCLFPVTGASGPAQTDKNPLRSQVYQQSEMCQDESCRQHRARAETLGGGGWTSPKPQGGGI